jgi:hypothetical protein
MLVDSQPYKWGNSFPMYLMVLIPTALESRLVFVLGFAPLTFRQ